MRKLKLFFACLLMAVLSIGQVWATDPEPETLFSFTGTSGYSIPSGWSSQDVSTGNYLGFSADGSYLTSPLYDPHNSVSLSFTVACLNSGTNHALTIYVLDKDDEVQETYTTGTPTGSSNYISTNSPWAIGDINYKFKIKFYLPEAGKGVRLRNTTLTGVAISSCTNTVTITKGAETNGTYTLSATSVCGDGAGEDVTISAITPAPGYEFDEITTSASGTVDNDLKKVTGITAATTITVKFKKKQKYTVSFNVGGSTASQADITEASAGAGITLPAGPTPTCTGWTFAGWKETSAVTEQTTTAPTLLAAGTNYKPAANCTLYAVYKQEAGSSTGTLDYTITFDDNSSDATSDISAADFLNYITTNKSKVSSVSDIVKCYKGETGLKLSSKKNNGSFVLTLSESNAITEVVLNTKKKSTTQGASYEVTVGSTAFSTSSTLSKDDFVDVEFTGTKTTSNSLSIASLSTTDEGSNSDGRVAWLKSIKIYYEGTITTYNYISTPTCGCSQLDAPTVSVPDGTLTYNGAKLTWGSVADADKYKVYIYNADKTAEIEHDDAVEGTEYTIAATLTATTTYKYSVQAISDTPEEHCASELTEGSFTTKSAPAATLTLSEIGETHNFAGDHTVGETVTLPLSATECSKTFVGWDPASNCTSAPAYAPGASYTLTATTQTLYAVYANPVGAATYVKTALASIPSGSEVVVTELYDETIYAAANDGGTSAGPAAVEVTETTNVLNVGSNTNIFWTITKSGDNFSFTVKGGTDKLYCTNTNNGVRVGTNENNVFSINNNYLYNNATSRYVGYNHGDGGLFRCYTTINTNINGETLAFYKKNVNYEDYSTACAAPLASPTFSVDPADGPFDTEISVVLDAAEGTIYYTLNGTDPTNESTEYIDPIVLNTCGNKTIKAIAISSTNHSAVASATYEMTIPVPSNSQVAPYSPTKAREVIASGCYDGSTIMYVKGVVKSTTSYDFEKGYYDVVVRNIGNEASETFTYYHMYKASGKTQFTSDENIEVGDTILAAGVLTLYGSTYEFANNTCYMVEHTKIASKTHIANDEAGAYTVEEAKAFCNAPTTYDLTDEVYVKGVAYGAPNSQGTFNIHDANSDNTFQIYKGTLSAALEALSVEIEENDTIVAKGTIQYYNSTSYQMNAGGEVVTVKKYVAPVIAVTGVELDETAISLKEGLSTTLVATVNPTEATNKTVTWVSSNPAVATVDNGVVTAVAIGTATITVTTEDGGLSATCTVKVIDPSARELPNAAFKKVTATDQITDGKYLIVYAAAGVDTVAFDGALTTLDAVGNTIDVTIDGEYIVAPGDAAFTIDVTNHTLKSYSGKYIGRTANSNGMNQADDATLTNTFAIDGDGNAVITSSGNPTLRYNKASDQIRFRYYKTGQQAIQLYKMVEMEEIRGNLNDGKWGTICPAKKVLVPAGASFYKLNYMELNTDGSPYKFFFDEIGENAYLEAGKPYLFIAEGTTITGVKVGDAADDGLHVHNGFVGYLGTDYHYLSSDYDVYTENANNYYGLQNNIFKLIYGGNSYMVNERAFVQITPTSKPATTEQPAPKYSRRRLVVGAGAPQVTTGMDELNASEKPVKLMINGQLFILRGEKMYDATGRLVK
ncbi:MAG: Ig-like domain-containing protein [Paludibacteraceae bacterium]|nr:Ig-like domain-containing protein [Paludibacteraceae bacterium]